MTPALSASSGVPLAASRLEVGLSGAKPVVRVRVRATVVPVRVKRTVVPNVTDVLPYG